MRVVNFFNLMIMAMAMFFTWNAIASEPLKVHVLQNLSVQESKEINQELSKLGYAPSKKELFTESHNAIVITKTLANEQEPASISIELVRLENEHGIPRTLFQYRVNGDDVHAMLKALPKPDAFTLDQVTSMAYQQ